MSSGVSPVDGPIILPDYSMLEHANVAHRDYVVVNWCIGNVCNYKCTYCPEGLHDGSSPWPAIDDVKNFCQKVIQHYQGKKIYFEFTGGEVTLWRDLPELLAFIKASGHKVGIISNGSRSKKFWSDFVDQVDHVCLSFHPEAGRTDHFFDIVELCAAKVRTHANFMMHPDHFDACLQLAERVADLKDISLAIQPLVIDMGEELYNYTAEQKALIDLNNHKLAKRVQYEKDFEYYRGAMSMVTPSGQRKIISPQRFISAGFNSWKGWDCYAGVEQIVVDMAGDVFRGWCRVGGIVGRITDRNLRLPTRPIRCDKDYCHCNLDIMSTKTKPRSSKLRVPFLSKRNSL